MSDKNRGGELPSAVRRLEKAGYGVIPPQQFRSDIDPDFFTLWDRISAYTMISAERGYALYSAVRYVIGAGIPGDFAECGVWKGGAAMLMALTVLKYAPADPRRIYLFDTFSGMTVPGENDRIAWNGRPVLEKWDEDKRGEKNNFRWWAVIREEVVNNMQSTAYPEDMYFAVEGDVIETVPKHAPGSLAILRLDTDWYESTAHELRHLYPRLSSGGVLLIDDYGHFTGARKAVDEYFSEHPVFLHRDDYTGRSIVKTAPAPQVR